MIKPKHSSLPDWCTDVWGNRASIESSHEFQKYFYWQNLGRDWYHPWTFAWSTFLAVLLFLIYGDRWIEGKKNVLHGDGFDLKSNLACMHNLKTHNFNVQAFGLLAAGVGWVPTSRFFGHAPKNANHITLYLFSQEAKDSPVLSAWTKTWGKDDFVQRMKEIENQANWEPSACVATLNADLRLDSTHQI